MVEEKKHHSFVRQQRNSYYNRRDLASDPNTRETVLSMIIDGADQAVYGLPYHHTSTHATQGAWKIKTHLMGAIVHGRKTYGFTYLDNVKHGNNLTIESLHRVLQDIFQRDGKFPRKLCLQLDNTSKQCKGRYVLGFLATLVAWGVFDEIELAFLPVGHTHEDIDQFFSCLARWLRHHNARCRNEMGAAVHQCYTAKDGSHPIVGNLENAANWSDFLPAFLNRTDKDQGRSGIFKFHQFRFRKTQAGDNVSMQVREWCDVPGDDWRGLDEDKLEHVMFKNVPTIQELQENIPVAQRKDPLSRKGYKSWLKY
jgi:hypothetical protein